MVCRYFVNVGPSGAKRHPGEKGALLLVYAKGNGSRIRAAGCGDRAGQGSDVVPGYCFSQIMVWGGSPGALPTSVMVLPSSETVYCEVETTLPFSFCTMRKP